MSAESALHPVDQERAAFRRLLLDNLNYFGNLEASLFKPIKPLVANTSYEQLTCVGIQPAHEVLGSDHRHQVARSATGATSAWRA